MNCCHALDESYGDTPMEQLTNVIFENKEKFDNKQYTILNELLLKVNDRCNFNVGKAHYVDFYLISNMFNATDDVKDRLDYCNENYNTEYEDEFNDDENYMDYETVITKGRCKVYLDTLETVENTIDFYDDFISILDKSFKSDKSYSNYHTAVRIAIEKHVKEVSLKLKDNIDYQWMRVRDCSLAYSKISPVEEEVRA